MRLAIYVDHTVTVIMLAFLNVLGSYSDSVGIDNIRKDVAKYISNRDGGIACNYEDIFLSTGASDGIKVLLTSIEPCPCSVFLNYS